MQEFRWSDAAQDWAVEQLKAVHQEMLDNPAKKAKTEDTFEFPIDLSQYKALSIDPFKDAELSPQQLADWKANIDLCRDAIVFFTACGSGTGYGGHTGGAFDTVPEVMLMDAFFRSQPDKFVPVFYDEAGHRVATQYLMAALQGEIDPKELRFYRQGHKKLPGHPELGYTKGIKFSSGRLGHMWPAVNGVAMAHKGKVAFCLGSDGSQMEGNDAEAARLAVAQALPVKLVVDDNNVTITGHPADYLKGYDVAKTLEGHGLAVEVVDGEDLAKLYAAMRKVVTTEGPCAVVCRRHMCPGIEGVENTSNGHDALAIKSAVPYLQGRGHAKAAEYLSGLTAVKDSYAFKGSGAVGSMRTQCGESIVKMIGKIPAAERTSKVMVIDSDLGGSTAMTKVQKAFPEVYVQSGVMERGNFSAAAGFGMEAGKQGIFSTFAAFLEMCCSEITMARLNYSNVLCHFSHSGVDDMADNTCHFGINNFFADNGPEEWPPPHAEGAMDKGPTTLFFPADAAQVDACLCKIFPEPGLRFLFTTRSKTPAICNEAGAPMYGEGYEFVIGKDEVVRTGTAGYIVAFGDALYRAVDAATRLKEEGIDVGVVNKPTLNMVDEDMMKTLGASPFVLVVEPLSRKQGLGIRFGTWLLERGLSPKYQYIGTDKEGCGGLWEHAYHQGYDPLSIMTKVKSMI